MYVGTFIDMYMHIYIIHPQTYLYIYIRREREKKNKNERRVGLVEFNVRLELRSGLLPTRKR